MENSKDKFNKFELLRKLNAKLDEGNDTKFVDIENLGEGKFSLTISLNNETLEKVIPGHRTNKTPFIIPRENTNSFIRKKELEQESNNLKLRLENARYKSIINNENSINNKETSTLNTRYRDTLDNSYLDLRGDQAESTDTVKLYKRSEEEYYRTGIYGTTIDILSNFASSGFYNEINDLEIKEYYDSWIKDVNFLDLVKKIYHSLWKYSICFILNSQGNYEPNLDGISSIPGKVPSQKTRAGLKHSVAIALNEYSKRTTGSALDYNKFSTLYDSKELAVSAKIPIAYTILDPKYIKIKNTGFFNKVTITITSKGLKPLADFLKDFNKDKTNTSDSAKSVLKLLPSGLKKAAEEGKDYTFNDEEISVIYLRKDDFETYSKPRGSRAFDSFDYKDELKKADFATIDGIYNYILKVTVGDDKNPVTDTATLEALAEAFNTPQKAFTVVWNHTLKIEKITSQGVSEILGKAKYEPVEADITSALGIAKALIDGSNLTGDAAILATKSLQSEINAARQQVETWIYQQYRVIAKSSGFSTYPVIRWKESVINTDSDAVTRASYMQMLDRKAISIQTYMREMGLDYSSEVQRMEDESKLIQKDILRAGSPYQNKGIVTTVTPSQDQGRPKGQPTTKKKGIDRNKVIKRKLEVPTPSQASTDPALEDIDKIATTLSMLNKEELESILQALYKKMIPSEE